MERHTIENDIPVFGKIVKTFPEGIGDVFHELIKMLPEGDSRPYYGITRSSEKGIQYIAAAQETYEGEGEKYGCEKFIVAKGEYFCTRVLDWRDKTDSIKYIFMDMLGNKCVDKSAACVEIYLDDREMLCLVKIDPSKEIVETLQNTTGELLQTISVFDETSINATPYEESWTAAQITEHITKSNAAIAKGLKIKGTPAERDPAARIQELKDTFLDFTVKFESPEFILPTRKNYERDQAIAELTSSIEAVKNNAIKADFSEIISLPVFGEISKLEILYFVVYHTQRHIRQLRNIFRDLKTQQKYEKS